MFYMYHCTTFGIGLDMAPATSATPIMLLIPFCRSAQHNKLIITEKMFLLNLPYVSLYNLLPHEIPKPALAILATPIGWPIGIYQCLCYILTIVCCVCPC